MLSHGLLIILLVNYSYQQDLCSESVLENISRLIDARLSALDIRINAIAGTLHSNNKEIVAKIDEMEENLSNKFVDKLSDLLDDKLASYSLEYLSEIDNKQPDYLESKFTGASNNSNNIKFTLEGVVETLESIKNVTEQIEIKVDKIGETSSNNIILQEDMKMKIASIEDIMVEANNDNTSELLQTALSSSTFSDCHTSCAAVTESYRKMEIFPKGCCSDERVTVLCEDLEGPWTIIQRRKDVEPRENFTRTWNDYIKGFGELDGEFWMGLNLIHELTSKTEHELYIILEDWEGEIRYAKYSHFRVGSPEENYRLSVHGYSGDAGDAMAYHNGQPFTTIDSDHDVWDTQNCAQRWKGGWWYNECHHTNLNGLPNHGTDTISAVGITWRQWRTDDYSLRSTTIKMRQKMVA
ncbi:unnamed protein product [Meganyctiphanes norvegica]|uniref:Fibrinogen C-terminal domain-containing protein n=1 Tax=Meganyctiphanes norvegica TaxID=48144 RepID=A0AAV2S017_MEGNR